MTETYSLNRHLDSAVALSLANDLLDLRNKPIRIDASAVSFCGTLPVQVLIAAQKQWQEDGQPFCVAPVSSVLAQAATSLGVALSAIGVSASDVQEVGDVA